MQETMTTWKSMTAAWAAFMAHSALSTAESRAALLAACRLATRNFDAVCPAPAEEQWFADHSVPQGVLAFSRDGISVKCVRGSGVALGRIWVNRSGKSQAVLANFDELLDLIAS